MKNSILFQVAVGLVLSLAIAAQVRSLYKHLRPQFTTVALENSKTCEPRSLSGLTDDGELICDFENSIALQPWPRLCGCPEFCESPCQ